MEIPVHSDHWQQRQYRWRVVALAAALLAGQAAAQVVYESSELTDEDAEAVAAVRRYTVEMIVFEHNDSRQSANESFQPDIEEDTMARELPQLGPGQVPEIGRIGPVSTPYFGDRGYLFESGATPGGGPGTVDRSTPEYRRWLDAQTLTEVPSHILQTRLEVLDAEVHAMPGIYRTLSRLGAYKPIMRAAWTQAVHEKADTLPIDLRRLGSPPLYLDGQLTLYLSRYLHLVVDLTIDAGETVLEGQAREPARYYGDRRTQNLFNDRYAIETAPVRYRIFEDRIFRNGETRYYDHPKFGVVARITRVEEAGEATGAAGSSGQASAPPLN